MRVESLKANEVVDRRETHEEAARPTGGETNHVENGTNSLPDGFFRVLGQVLRVRLFAGAPLRLQTVFGARGPAVDDGVSLLRLSGFVQSNLLEPHGGCRKAAQASGE